MTGDSSRLPEEPMTKRQRLRAEWKAESTWRRHEILGRLSKVSQRLDKTTAELAELLPKIQAMFAHVPPAIRVKGESVPAPKKRRGRKKREPDPPSEGPQ